ncbi:hypothetical protein BKA61DRAFT_593427 [Leptodontidium sp. MPI-SDFR-AT-0119]|nr:hypothetical protein BKA61DRAFT_593427 [Leptodontidium sp. MPI-SDFR-AT-0119]
MQFLSLFLCACLALTVSAAPYIVTSYVVLSVYTESAFTYLRGSTTIPESVYTYTSNVAKPTAAVSVLSTLTESAAYADVTVVYEVLESGSPVSRTPASDYLTGVYTSYFIPITYSAASTCSGQDWTFSTNVPVTLPAIITPTPVTATTSTTTYPYGYYNEPQQTYVVAILNATDVDADEVAYASSLYEPSSMAYCYTPTTTCSTPTGSAAKCTATWVYDTSSSSSGSGSGYYYGDYHSDRYWLTPLILICVLVPVGWFLLWLIIGLLESWMSFKGLMLGQHRKRGLPYAWCCISIIFLCWTGPTYKAKSPEEQAVLLERWKEMKKGEKFKLWMKWGFRWKYPTMLGEEPEIAKRALRQGCL